MRTIPMLFVAATIAGCAGSQLTPQQQSYLTSAMSHPAQFWVRKSDCRRAWDRGVDWIQTYSSMDLKSVNDSLIETLPAGKGRDWETTYAYNVVRQKIVGDSVLVAVTCSTNHAFRGAEAKQNQHMLAYYIATGEIPPPVLIVK